MQRTLLVTGSSGLVGHAVLARLRSDYRCVGIDAARASDPVAGVVTHELDLQDAAALVEIVHAEQVTDVVHAGAISSPLLLVDRPSTVLSINVQGTQNVLETARLGGVQRLVFLSSAAVYGSASGDEVVDESAALRPDSIYGASKAAAEMIVSGYHTSFHMQAVILRPVSIYGSRRQTASLVSYLVSNALDGLPSRVASASQALDLMHVEDVASAVALALETTCGVGRAYTIGTGVQTSYAEIADMVRRLIPGSRIDLEPGCGDREPRFDVTSAQRDLGFRAEYDLEHGLRQVIDVLRDRPALRAQARAAYA